MNFDLISYCSFQFDLPALLLYLIRFIIFDLLWTIIIYYPLHLFLIILFWIPNFIFLFAELFFITSNFIFNYLFKTVYYFLLIIPNIIFPIFILWHQIPHFILWCFLILGRKIYQKLEFNNFNSWQWHPLKTL